MKFKVGDKIQLKKGIEEGRHGNYFPGAFGKIKDLDPRGYPDSIKVDFECIGNDKGRGSGFVVYIDEIEHIRVTINPNFKEYVKKEKKCI